MAPNNRTPETRIVEVTVPGYHKDTEMVLRVNAVSLHHFEEIQQRQADDQGKTLDDLCTPRLTYRHFAALQASVSTLDKKHYPGTPKTHHRNHHQKR